MQDVPNIVRKRLQATGPDSAHPDANVLTSFAEKSLPERERANVFEHLARCADCREILAFSMPEESVAQPVVKPSPTRWLTWPVLRWGVVVAGIAIVSSVGILQYRRSQTPMLAERSESVQVTLQQTEPSPLSSAPANIAKSDDLARPNANRVTTSRAERLKTEPAYTLPAPQRPAFQPKAAITDGLVAGSSVGGPIQSQKVQQSPMPAAPAAPMLKQPSQAWATTANAPKSSTTVEVSGEAPLLETTAQPAPAELSSQQQSDENSLALSKAKPAMTPAVPSAKMALAPAPRWTISATGGLQRSFDQGQTWQDVNVAAGEMSSANFAQGLAKAPADKAVVTKQRTASLTFRAVAANGTEVWAGGVAGTLYHSVDAGTNWTRIVPSSAGATLTGDIVSVEFADPQQGRIQTSSGEVWTTTDGGQTWQKQ